MAFFKTLRIREYIGARHVDLDSLDRLCVLVGPNGCGKTSVLRAAAIITDAIGLPEDFDLEVQQIAPDARFIGILSDGTSRTYRWPHRKEQLIIPHERGQGIWLFLSCENLPFIINSEISRKICEKMLGVTTKTDEEGKITIGPNWYSKAFLSPGLQKLVDIMATAEWIRENLDPTPINVLFDLVETDLEITSVELLIKELFKLVFPINGPQGQLIMSTHSPVVLSLLPEGSIYRLERYTMGNQVVGHGASVKRDVYTALIGNSLLTTITMDLFSVDDDTEFRQFIEECLKEPAVSDSAKDGDAQKLQLSGFLTSRIGVDTRILDFGAGTGRNILSLAKSFSTFSSNWQLCAYESNDESRKTLAERLSNVNLPNVECLGTLSKIQKSTFDIILLSNVLHEIENRQVIQTLSLIRSLLHEDGYLIIQEHQLVQGERDFIVFSEDELKFLLRCGGSSHERSKTGLELLFYCVRRSEWHNDPTEHDLYEVMQHVFARAKSQVRALRDKSSISKLSKSDILKHAFYHALLVNATLVIDDLQSHVS